MKINFNILDEENSLVQIYGDMTGVAQLTTNCNTKYYQYSVKFFDNKSRLVKLISSPKDMTIHTLDDLEKRLYKKYIQECSERISSC